MQRKFGAIVVILISVFVLPCAVFAAQDTRYKEVTVTPHRQEYFSLQFSKEKLTLQLPLTDKRVETTADRRTLAVSPTSVASSGKPLFDQAGIHIGDTILQYDSITDLQIYDTAGAVIIRFQTSPSATDPVAQKRRGNRITFTDPITIAAGEFVRGMVFSVAGDITVNGEVNKDVVSLFGNIDVGQTSVVRGDLATINGSVNIERKASVYGNSYIGSDDSIFRTHRLNRGERHFGVTPYFYYDRVDGANPNLEARFVDTDSTLPTVWASLGWAFESGRWRIKGSIEQTVFKPYGLTLGIQGYRDLLSDDDWLLSDRENTVYALLVTEDFKDYYEATGGSMYLKARPIQHLVAELGYKNEATNWTRAHRDIWSLFGGNKRFSENFTTVPNDLRPEGIAQIDTGRIASVYAALTFDSRASDPFSASAWALTLSGEVSDPDLNSDHDFSRFTASLRRYQKFSHHSILAVRGIVGGSSGNLPMHRTFYLGGLGTLHGYRHKELSGSRFWMLNTEYRHTIPRTDIAVAFLWDAAQVGYYRDPWGDIEMRHSVGGAVYLGDDVRISIARRLDGFTDRDPRIFVRFEHAF